MGPVFTGKVTTVAVGFLQIITEPVPPLDFATDVLAATLQQSVYQTQARRALYEFKLYLRKAPPEARLEPRLYPAPGYKYSGVQFYTDETVYHTYAAPLAQVTLTHPSILDRQVPFRIIGELPILQTEKIYDYVGEFAKSFGIQARGGVYYLPLDISAWAEEDVSEGDRVLDGYGRYRRKNSVSNVVSWVATCRRGAQVLKVRLRNGEIALGPPVLNRYMSQVTDLRVQGVAAGNLHLPVGQTLSGLKVIGASPYLPDALWPDLTGRRECLDMAISNTSVARLDRGATTVGLAGIAAGTTTLKLLLRGSDNVAGVADIVKEIPVRVAAGFLWSRINHKLYGTLPYGSMVGTLYSEGPITWSGNKFSLQVQDYDLVRTGGPPYELTISGSLSPDGMKVVQLNYRRYRKYIHTYRGSDGREYLTYDERLTEWSVTNVPLISDPKVIAEGTLARYEIRGPAAGHLHNYTEIEKFWSGLAQDFPKVQLRTSTGTISFSAPTDGISIELFR